MGDLPAPFDAYRTVVRPEWIDDNGHMNMGYYVVVFDLATDEWMRFVGLDREHRRAREVTTFCLEAHVTYHREVRAGDPLPLHVSRPTRRGAPMAPEVQERLARIRAAHEPLPRLPQVGRVMGLGARPTTR